MDDLISRQMAIDALADYINNVDKVYSTGKLSADDCMDAAKSVLDELPSAQPERQIELDGTESNVEILSELRAQFNCFDEAEEPVYRALSDAICALSAQSERKRGKWILTEDEDYEYCTCSECGYQNGENWMNGSDIPFCAECGADMRGENNVDNE